MKTKNIPIWVIIMVIMASCVAEHGDIQELENPTQNEYNGFDLETVNIEQISIRLNTSDKSPISGVLVKFWTASPIAGGELILKGLTDQNGLFMTEYNLPSSEESLVIETNYIGLSNYLVVSRSDLAMGIEIAGQSSEYEVLSDHLIPNTSIDHDGENSSAGGRVLVTNYEALGNYNSSGVPDYLEPNRDIITSEMLSFINASLPEGQPVPDYHPKYIAENAQSNLVITETADVWMTFVHEGAGYKNILGYYTYPTGSEPASVEDIETVYVAFPNASFQGSGGGLYAGDKVNLGRFEPGTTIGFTLMANGWRGSITSGIHQVYSNNDLNPESIPEQRAHSVLLWDSTNELFLVGFEDLNRDSGSDNDFNDAIFYITSNPVEAISTEGVNPIDEPTDDDGDGVNNVYDEFPEDPRYAYSYKYPGENSYGTFAFEDQWPRKGDYDFNDLVVDYQYDQYANAVNKMVLLKSEFVIKAVGAGYSNGFGFQLDLSPGDISNVTGQDVRGSLYTFNGNGTEAGQSKAVIMVSDHVHQGFEGNGFINTTTNLAYQTPDTIKVDISFSNAMALSGAGSAPFNPFLVVNRDRGREIHLPGYAPTDLVDASFFGQSNDITDMANGIYYKTNEGLPWGMNLPVSFDYPLEKTDIREGYNHFNTWAQSGGFTYMDWYTDNLNFRTHSKLYSR